MKVVLDGLNSTIIPFRLGFTIKLTPGGVSSNIIDRAAGVPTIARLIPLFLDLAWQIYNEKYFGCRCARKGCRFAQCSSWPLGCPHLPALHVQCSPFDTWGLQWQSVFLDGKRQPGGPSMEAGLKKGPVPNSKVRTQRLLSNQSSRLG